MSYHSSQYLNTKCKKGNTKKTGYAWWFNQALEDPNNPSHYEGFIPITVLRDFFGWSAAESVKLEATFSIDGQEYVVPVSRFKALGRTDWITAGIPENEEQGADKILDVPNIDYGVHDPKQVFISNVADLFGGGDNIGCESFGELKWGRRLFASFSIPENLDNEASGLSYRPIMTVVTSYDRTLATKYVRTFGIPVCDNTVNYELSRAGEKDGHYVLRHSKNSGERLLEARKVLGLLTEQAEEMDAWLTELSRKDVSMEDFQKWMKIIVPIPDPKETIVTVKSIQGEDVQTSKVSYRAQTIAMKMHEKMLNMWDNDPRVNIVPPSRARIFQLWNTIQHHEVGVKATAAMGGGAEATEAQKDMARINARIESNMEKLTNVKGNNSFLKEDLRALDIIAAIQDDKVGVGV